MYTYLSKQIVLSVDIWFFLHINYSLSVLA